MSVPSDTSGERVSFPWNAGNRGRWNNDRGTLNLIDETCVLRGIAEVTSGRAISCSRDLTNGIPSYYPEAAPSAYHHEMITAWKGHAPGDIQVASDQFMVQTHGMTITHIDALCHFGFEGKGFNAHDFGDIVSMDGAQRCDVETLGVIATRAVLVDVPRDRSVAYLTPGDPVTLTDLEPALENVMPGDALLVRTGRWEASSDEVQTGGHGALSGLHPECMLAIQHADVALLGTDAGGDNFPQVSPENPRPVHIFALSYLGLPLLHNLSLDLLGGACHDRGASSFFFVVAPLRMPGATGSPVTPVALL